MRPVLFSIGDVKIYSYGLMYALALVCGLIWAERRAKKFGLNKDTAFNIGFFTILTGVLGAKLLHLITVADQLAEDFWGTLKNSLSQGFVVYGGIIAGVLFALIYCRAKKLPFLRYFDLAVAPIALGQCIGRIGCFLSGCCYGLPTDAWYGVTFPAGSNAPAGVALIPVQLISSFLNLINVLILVFAHKRFKTPGRTAALYMITYGIGRFFVEFLRNDPRGEVGLLSTSQFISIGVTAGGILLMILAGKFKKGGEELVGSAEEESAEEEEAGGEAAVPVAEDAAR